MKPYCKEKMKSRRNNAFTLIELIIAITISTMLMVSVTVFVWDVMRITKKSEKLLDTQAWSTAFDNKLSEIFSNLTWPCTCKRPETHPLRIPDEK